MTASLPNAALERDMCNAIRALAMDAVQKANSGHPGMPMGMAEVAYALWTRHLRHNPSNPKWPNRDRFILSNGHGSMLHYALLHLTGYDLPIGELANFRQLHSRTPGHPERGLTPGVETTTGPLGQGLANAVGMALAERLLAAEFNRPGFEIVDHHTYVVVDDSALRFRAYQWNVIGPIDGHDPAAADIAIAQARHSDRPTLIIARTVIGKGSPNRAGSEKAHGEALGEAEVAATRQAIGWPHPPFQIPPQIYQAWDARAVGADRERTWRTLFEQYAARHPRE